MGSYSCTEATATKGSHLAMFEGPACPYYFGLETVGTHESGGGQGEPRSKQHQHRSLAAACLFLSLEKARA